MIAARRSTRGSWLARANVAALAIAGRRKAGSLTTSNRLLLTAIAALALAGAAHAQEIDSHVAIWASKGLGASHPFAGTKKRRATRSRRRSDRLLQEHDEQSGVYGRGAEGHTRLNGGDVAPS